MPVSTARREPDDDPEGYLGMLVDDAARLARERGWATVRSVPSGVAITLEYLPGRLNFVIEDGTVTQCWKG